MRIGSDFRVKSALGPLAALLWALQSPSALGFSYEVTDQEWLAWPEYCRVKYSMTPVGASRRGYSKAEIKRWKNTLGKTFDHVHHYCAGLVSMQRAQRQVDPEKRKGWYGQAIGAIDYTYRGSEPDYPLFSQMSAYYGKALFEYGRMADAKKVLEKGIAAQPEAPESYVMLAEVIRKDGDFPGAREILEQYYARGGAASPELDYNLAYVCLQLEDYECARRFTKSALAGGYPLTGLKRKLQAAGQWR